MLRKPVVAGAFYPASAEELTRQIREMVDPSLDPKRAIAIVSPHAGYIYSGRVAGALFSSVQLPQVFVLVGPSHRLTRSRVAIMPEGAWATPLGTIPIHAELAKTILAASDLVETDEEAHRNEHSLEVQLPFLQYFLRDFSIVPICIGYQVTFAELDALGRSLAQGIKDFGGDVLMVASTDMSHYVDQATAKKKDFLAIQRILDIDPSGLHETVSTESISMCGFQPTTAVLAAAKELGASCAELIRYETSGETSGDYNEVVGYAGLRIA